MVEYWTIEVLDGAFSALRWRDSHGDALVEAAQTNRVMDWQWTEHPWGVALELGFTDETHWVQFRALPVVQAALDAVPNPGAGLLVYPGRGGTSGALVPRKPRPAPAAGAAALPMPPEHIDMNVAAPARTGPTYRRRRRHCASVGGAADQLGSPPCRSPRT